MPAPFYNLVGPPLQDTLPPEAMAAMQGGGEGGPLLGFLQNLLGQMENAPAPEPMPVPGRVNPFAGMASIFAGQFAENLGARGAAGAARENIAQREQQAMAAENYNRQIKMADLAQRRAEKIDILLRIGEAKQKLYEHQGNMAEAEKQATRNLNYLRQQTALAKELAEYKSNLKLEEMAARNSTTKSSPAPITKPSLDEFFK